MRKHKILNARSFAGITLVVALLIAISASDSSAATSTWSRQPSSAGPTAATGANAARKVRPARESRYGLSPFAPESNNISLAVGQTFLMGDLSRYSDSIGTQLQYTYGVSEMFGFNAALGYSNHSDGKYSQTTLLTGLRTNLAWFDRVIPYAVFGLGFYKPRMAIDELTSVSPVVFGLHLGPGVDLQLTDELFFGAGLTFHDIFGTTENTTRGPIDVGGTFTTFLVHAGMAF